MPDNKLTDNEIIKALECCVPSYTKKCDKCVYEQYKSTVLGKPLCSEYMRKNTLDLINGLQEKNERLERENKHYAELEQGCYVTGYKNIKAEAYKECIEKVKEEIKQALKSNYRAIQGRIAYYENEGDMFVGDEFVDYCNGKVDCLRGLDYFLDNLLKELVGE